MPTTFEVNLTCDGVTWERDSDGEYTGRMLVPVPDLPALLRLAGSWDRLRIERSPGPAPYAITLFGEAREPPSTLATQSTEFDAYGTFPGSGYERIAYISGGERAHGDRRCAFVPTLEALLRIVDDVGNVEACYAPARGHYFRLTAFRR
jgi:hypothetical protein